MKEREEIQKLRQENLALCQMNESLLEKVNLLLSIIEKQSHKKDSHNSSLPPSSDIGRKQRSLRPPSEKKVGGQQGHTGHTLEMTATPDIIHHLKSDYCQGCGSFLSEAKQTLVSHRQVVDIPPIKPIYEEYRQYGCMCDRCGHHQKAAYPAHVKAPIQYGNRVMSIVSYLSVYQYLPYKRLSHFFSAILGMPLSQGTLNNLLEKASEKSAFIYQHIRQNIEQSSVVGSDETSAKVNGEKWWIWVWQNVQNTFIAPSQNRGFATIETHFDKGFAQATLISDRWAAQLKALAQNHQLCIAHLLRDSIFLKETEKSAFADAFFDLLNQALVLRKELESNPKTLSNDNPKTAALQKQLNDLLAQVIDKAQYPQTGTFQESIIKNRNYLFPFLYNLDIPPDNNASERAIRNIKVKQKISGQFKSGQNAFCILRSLIDTFIKRKLDVFDALFIVFNFQPE
jgi:transposase